MQFVWERESAGEKLLERSFSPDPFSRTYKKVLINNKEISLKKKEFEILDFFCNRINRLIDKDTLAEFVWGEDFESMGNYDFLYTQMKNLRKKLKESEASLELKSIYGVGYKLVEKENESSL